VTAPANPRYDALIFYVDGTAAIVSQSEIQSTENIENAVGGFHHILVDGKLAERVFTRHRRHPRSAAGISACGEYLYLMAIDGRRSTSVGATEIETALLLFALGSWNGINFDGGGSTTLALRFPNGRVKVVNTPIHSRIPGQQRAVAGSLGVR
jgi:exopolysaccharide biosynthesis protein